MTLTRRAAMASLCLGAAAGCTATDTPSTTPTGEPRPAPAEEPETEQEDPAPTAVGTTLGPATDVPVGGAVIYPAAAVVVARPATATYVGFSAVCTHAGCLVDRVRDGMIGCPCHGSRFRLDGTVAAGPAAGPLPQVTVTVRAGILVVS